MSKSKFVFSRVRAVLGVLKWKMDNRLCSCIHTSMHKCKQVSGVRSLYRSTLLSCAMKSSPAISFESTFVMVLSLIYMLCVMLPVMLLRCNSTWYEVQPPHFLLDILCTPVQLYGTGVQCTGIVQGTRGTYKDDCTKVRVPRDVGYMYAYKLYRCYR